jgi:rod shape determining protein RodA
MFERRLYHYIDWALVGAVLLLCGLGLAMIYSTTYDLTRQAAGPQVRIQLYALLLGIVALAICLLFDYRSLAEHSLILYGALVVLLLYVLFFGEVRGGSRRWISLGVVNLQPSEFARIGAALVLATFFGENRRGARTSNDLLVAFGLTLVPIVLIARQPDLGTAATLLPVYLGIAFVAGLRMRLLAAIALVALLAAPVAWTYALEDYQRSRLSTFLDPQEDPRGAGYQQIQARITVGSGGLTGKGFMQGTQGQYKFLPVAHNDFIFSVLAEELGFIGVLAALGLYLFVILRSIEAARLAKDRLGSYLVVGVASGFAFQVIYNITMSAGLAPVKGLTLPLMSYGGSSMIATLAGFGLILNVRMRRFTN